MKKKVFRPLSWDVVVAISNGLLSGPMPEDFYGPGFPCQPTDSIPGSAEKIEAMMHRYEKRQQLFHRLDRR